MVFQVSIGISDLKNDGAKDDEGKKYSLFIGDTVIVGNKVNSHRTGSWSYRESQDPFSSVNFQNEPATALTTSKKKLENIGVFMKVS
jgi:hypothetical protein